MTMLLQPPPDAPAPPPSAHAIRSQRKMAWIWIIGIVSVIFCLLVAPTLFRKRGNHDQPEVVSNIRQIGLALFEFEQAYGSMPDFDTGKTVRDDTLTSLKLGTVTSNDFFRQLIAAEITQSEQMFYARVQGSRKPDSVITGTKALEKGECGFTYLIGAFKGCNPERPLVVTPMIPDTDRFDPKPFKGKVVVLKADNCVTTLPIDKSGHAILFGKNLMDPAHPVWEGKPPAIAWPEL
jgi:hypothetical protein